MHGQEVRRVAELLDERELVRELILDLGRRPRRPPARGARPSERLEVRVRRSPRRHELAGVAVAERAEIEGAAGGERDASAEGLGGVERAERRPIPEVSLPVRVQAATGLGEGAAVTNAGHEILQRASCAHVHVRAAGGDERQIVARGHLLEPRQVLLVVGSDVQLERDRRLRRERPHPAESVLDRLSVHGVVGRDEESGYAFETRALEERVGDDVLALRGRAAGGRDQRAERAVGGSVACEEHEAGAIAEIELGADDEPKGRAARLAKRLEAHVRAHDACERALVGDRERVVAERRGALDELGGARRATEETVVRQCVQFGVGRGRGHAARSPFRGQGRSPEQGSGVLGNRTM